MVKPVSAADLSRDLFGGVPFKHKNPVVRRAPPRELEIARALCRQLRRKRARPDKQRIAHLICLNLVNLLEHAARR